MKTYRFSWRGRDRFIDAHDIFAAVVEFHAHYNGTEIEELLITEIKGD